MKNNLLFVIAVFSVYNTQGMLNEGTPREKELFNIFVEIRGLQYTCVHILRQHLVPNRFKHLSLLEAQERQKSLIPRMRELAKDLDNNRLQFIVSKAEWAAIIERESIM